VRDLQVLGRDASLDEATVQSVAETLPEFTWAAPIESQPEALRQWQQAVARNGETRSIQYNHRVFQTAWALCDGDWRRVETLAPDWVVVWNTPEACQRAKALRAAQIAAALAEEMPTG